MSRHFVLKLTADLCVQLLGDSLALSSGENYDRFSIVVRTEFLEFT